MLPKVQVFAIEGFDEAIIGIAYRGGYEVLVYDGEIAEARVATLAKKPMSLHDYLTHIALHKLGDKAPVFAYLDIEIGGDLSDSTREPGTPIH